MKCPFCGSFNDSVIDSRPIEHTAAVKRRRECLDCKKRYTTFERPESNALMVVKSDSRREPFDRKKLSKGVEVACIKRPISTETIDKIVSDVENSLDEYVMEVPTSVIGGKVLEKLWDIDPVAYVRFASVYQKFSNAEDFMNELKNLKKKSSKKRKNV
jgi:transcriptional repressor NrdR